jgi:histidine triad (HIT) family protein
MTTIFTQISAGEVPASFIHRDDEVAAFMDIQPVNPGHVLVVPVVPIEYFYELDDATCGRLFQVVKRISKAIRDSEVPAEEINLFLADAPSAGQEIAHAHLHIFPRFKNGGFELKFAKRYFHPPSRTELDTVAYLIRQALK